MRRHQFIIGLMFFLGAGLPAVAASNSADAEHLHVELVIPHDQLYPGGTNRAGLYFKLEPGWHVYWQNAGDSGEPPRIHWTLPDGVTAAPLQFPAPTRLPLGPLMDYGYENEVLFPFSFQVADSAKQGPAALHAKVDWLVCREVCIPGKAELDENIQLLHAAPMPAAVSGPDQALWDRLANNLPQPLPAADTAVFQPIASGFRLAVSTGRREKKAEFFPEDQNILNNPAPQTVTPTSAGLVLELKKDPNLTASPAQLKGVLELSGGRNYEIAATPGAVAAPPPVPAVSLVALARIVGLAFLGGLLLNLMPCVFPVLFLKGLALCRSGTEGRRELCAHGLVYAAGILVSFWVLVAVLLGLRAAGATLGWGFQFQSPVFLFLLSGLFFLLGLSLAGQFEIGISLTSAGGSLAAKQGYAGSFFHWSAGRRRGHAMHRAVYGRGHRLRARAARGRHLRRVHGACARPRCALRGAHAAACVDSPAAQARRMDGRAETGCVALHVWHGHLAYVGRGAGLWRRAAGGAAFELSAACRCGVVPGPMAG